jgi:hypothetical protein
VAGALLLAAGCGAPPMTLTKALFAERDNPPRLVEGRYVCDVRAVRQRPGDPATRALAVDVAFQQPAAQALPPHLHAYSRPEPGADAVQATFSLTPAETRRRWPEDFAAVDAQPAGLALRFHDARYFSDGMPSVEVTFAGSVSSAAAVEVVARSEVPRQAARAELAEPGFGSSNLPPALAGVMRAVRRHPWPALAGLDPPAAGFRCDPIAWLGPGGAPLSQEELTLLLQPWREVELRRRAAPDLAIERCALLLRLVGPAGDVHHLRVPLPLLREGDDLTLAGRDGRVAWVRREVWRGRMLAEPGPTAEWPASGLRLAQARVPYGYDDLVTPSTWPGAIARAVAAPFAWAIDVLAWTNPMLQALLRRMVGEPEPFRPTRSDR